MLVALIALFTVTTFAGGIAAYGTTANLVTAKRPRDAYGVSVRIEKLSDSQTICAPAFTRQGRTRRLRS